MHELTLLYGVVDKVGKVVEENGLDHVDAIVIEVGEATSVIPEFLQDGYEVISDDYDFLRGSELIIERVKENSGGELVPEIRFAGKPRLRPE